MKKHLFLLFIICASISSISHAQIVQKGTSTLQIGYGFPSAMQIVGSVFKYSVVTDDEEASAEFKFKGLGPFHFRYDYMIGGRVGLGISSNAEFGNFNFKANYNDIDDNNITSETNFKYTSINAMARMNIHFIKEPKTIDIYYGFGVGYSYTRVNLEEKLGGNLVDPENQAYVDDFNKYLNSVFKALPIAIEEVFGLKAPIGQNAGIYFEIGYSKALAQVGFFAKIGGPKGYKRDNWRWY